MSDRWKRTKKYAFGSENALLGSGEWISISCFGFFAQLSHEVFQLNFVVGVCVRTLECKYEHVRTLFTAFLLTHAN